MPLQRGVAVLDTMTRNRSTRLDRRTALKTLGGLAVGGSGLAAASGSAAAAGAGLVGVGVNTIDYDGGGADLRVVSAPDPAGGGTVIHATSSGTKTTDYATSMVSTGGVTLGSLGQFAYDYYGGKHNQRSAPDEVWMLLEDANGTHHVVFRQASTDPDGQQWRTRNVLAEIRGKTSPSPGVEWARLADGGGSGGFDVEYLGANLLGTFGAGAVIRRVGVGRGRTSGGGTVADTYFRNLRLNGRHLDLPAAGRESVSNDRQQASDDSQQSASVDSQQSASDDGQQSASGGGGQQSLPKVAVVSSPGADESNDYVFEVTGDLVNLEPDEDSGEAFDEVIDAGGRTRVEGTVQYADDRFAFSGDLIEIDVPPQVRIEVRNR